ncbi:MAG: ribonuclease P protein component [Promicromonosporaceae bacterium]|nr:ribonuclease P protein component [Promicromonosporaceae bacterium]
MGVRAGRSTVVVHLAATGDARPPQVGFVVSKAVGNAVQRNLVKRRLRAIAVAQMVAPGRYVGMQAVMRALPAAAAGNFQTLSDDVSGALATATARLTARVAT